MGENTTFSDVYSKPKTPDLATKWMVSRVGFEPTTLGLKVLVPSWIPFIK